MVRRGGSATAAGLFAFVLAGAVTAVVAGVASPLDTRELLSGFVVSNAIIGVSLAVAGWPIANYRPGNPIGWLLLASGACYATSAAGVALLAAAASPGTDTIGWRVLATVTNGAWTWAISVLVPVCLLIFPDGRLPSRRWRWIVVVAAVNSLVFLATALVSAPTLSTSAGVAGYFADPDLAQPHWVAAAAVVATIAGTVVFGGAVAALAVRYRRGDDRVRRQVLWLLQAALIVFVVGVVDAAAKLDSWVSIFSITLLPLAVLIALRRHQLLDIRLVVSRTLLYLVLTAVIIAAYAGLVTAFDAALRRQVGLGSSVVATLLVVCAFNWLRAGIQRRIDRMFFGARRDPVRAIAAVGARLGEVGTGGATGLGGVLEALCRVMRLPSASITSAGTELASYGSAPPVLQSMPLRQGGESIGALVIGLRSGEGRLDANDERVIGLLCAPLAVAVHATLLVDDLNRTRDSLVTAREEERRRLRRDLHDGLGPALTGVVLKADAARRIAGSDAGQVATLLAELRAQTTDAVEDIRRLVSELRPPALDGLGLIDALREQAMMLGHRVDGAPLRVRITADEPLPPLPPAAEVAAYRIVTEALNNVTRHSSASAASVGLRADSKTLQLAVCDNGATAPGGQEWRPGVGLTSMRERVAELGGEFRAGPGPGGGEVTVCIPLASAR